jgi:hypothetical protein
MLIIRILLSILVNIGFLNMNFPYFIELFEYIKFKENRTVLSS